MGNQKRNDRGITLIVFSILIIAILAIAFSLIYYIFYKTGNNTIQDAKDENLIQQNDELKMKIKENEWNESIVSDVTQDDVAIPRGFKYVSGNTNTGLIIENNEDGTQYLFIPYQENISTDVNEYYKKVNYLDIETDVLDSIKKYKGFFVKINTNFKKDDLKTIDKKNYEFQAKQLFLDYNNSKSVKSHILYKEEIAQIDNYIKSDRVNIGNNTIGIEGVTVESFASLNINEQTISTSNNNLKSGINIVKSSYDVTKVSNSTNNSNYVWMYKSDSDIYNNAEIPIPSGFKYCVSNGIVKIQDENNQNLIYIWVPLSKDLLSSTKDESAKEKLWTELYQKYASEIGKTYSTDTELYKMIFNSKETWTEWFKNSINEWNGFYISEAELGYDSNNKPYNKARGMVKSSVTNTINGGDYYRMSNIQGLSLQKIKEISQSHQTNSSVISHTMYGVEYDATLLWIANTNSDCTDSKGNKLSIPHALAGDSSTVGKYATSGLNETSNSQAVASFNGIWGLGGNLAEFTMETYSDSKAVTKYISRGGSYRDSGGEGYNIASRLLVNFDASEEVKESVGFRVALCVKNTGTGTDNVQKITTEASGYQEEYQDDTTFEENGIKFDLLGNQERYVVNWNGINVYKEPKEDSEKKGELVYADKIVVFAKAKENVTSNDGKEITWAKVKIGNDTGYINANDLTETVFTAGDNVNYIESGNTKRYFNNGLTIYAEPTVSDNKVMKKYSYVGSIEVIGKSIDENKKWALVKVNDKKGFVESEKLMGQIETETNNDVTFILGDKRNTYISQDNVQIFDAPNDGSNEVKKLNKNDEISIVGISEDRIWAKTSDATYVKVEFLKESKETSATIENDDSNTDTNERLALYIPSKKNEYFNKDGSINMYIKVPNKDTKLESLTVNGVKQTWSTTNKEYAGVKYNYYCKYTINESKSGKYTYNIVLKDNNNEETKDTLEAKYDMNGPVISSCSIKGNKVTMNAKDDYSGVSVEAKNVLVRLRNKNYYPTDMKYSDGILSFTIKDENYSTKEDIKYIKIEDNAGNEIEYNNF